ncbi:hypothetical protein [Commensalibacter nepenthis]|uniref:Uncharacterized protein n=1 Tax=Commensalibacter nepenthis TaxID=3043872 RepID=A0ABT6QAJ0_9PROT|nr:hypothetical protein [Commensalibacter sp. TBRC 10068]MDI2113912.1 hypothetical protein [Commensalibacter sp. TBRC 10068]
MNSSKEVYMYDDIGRQHDVTKYYDTGLFYIYTDPEDSTSQSFIRKKKPIFMDKETFLRALNDSKFPIKEERKELLIKIINVNPNFIENMDYNSTSVSEIGDLSDIFSGFYILDNQKYMVSIFLDRYSVDSVNHDKIDDVGVWIDKDNRPFQKTYEEMYQIAARPF